MVQAFYSSIFSSYFGITVSCLFSTYVIFIFYFDSSGSNLLYIFLSFFFIFIGWVERDSNPLAGQVFEWKSLSFDLRQAWVWNFVKIFGYSNCLMINTWRAHFFLYAHLFSFYFLFLLWYLYGVGWRNGLLVRDGMEWNEMNGVWWEGNEMDELRMNWIGQWMNEKESVYGTRYFVWVSLNFYRMGQTW